MRKFLLFGTIFVASTAWAFGGIGLGLKSSSHKNGVSAIGVHVNGKNKTNIKTECPEHSAWSDETLKCECDTWYVMNEETHECEETCGANRQCGDTCCGADNICVGGNKCCHKDYEGDEEQCCDTTSSVGYANDFGRCCAANELLVTQGGSVCSPPDNPEICEDDYILLEYKHAYYCCPEGSVGVNDEGSCF